VLLTIPVPKVLLCFKKTKIKSMLIK